MYRASLTTIDPDHDLDAAHDAVVVLLERGQLETDRKLFTIARNKGIDEVRRRQRHALLTENAESLPDQQSTDPAQLVEQAEQKSFLHALVCRLPAELSCVVFLRYWAGENVNTIATVLGIRPPTVYKRLGRAHEQIEEWLKSYDLR